MKKKYCPDTEQKNSYLNFTPTNRLLRERSDEGKKLSV